MTVEESITIHAPLETVWRVFVDLTCWAEWNTVLRDVTSPTGSLETDDAFYCSIRPLVFPVFFEPQIEEVVPFRRVVWRGKRFGVTSIHEFVLDETADGVRVRSRETFAGLPVFLAGPVFPTGRITQLTRSFLADLKNRAEHWKAEDGGRRLPRRV